MEPETYKLVRENVNGSTETLHLTRDDMTNIVCALSWYEEGGANPPLYDYDKADQEAHQQLTDNIRTLIE